MGRFAKSTFTIHLVTPTLSHCVLYVYRTEKGFIHVKRAAKDAIVIRVVFNCGRGHVRLERQVVTHEEHSWTFLVSTIGFSNDIFTRFLPAMQIRVS